jgi:hypothetical protein
MGFEEAMSLEKKDLEDQEYYLGLCRNAEVALWDAKNNCFWYMKDEYSVHFKESIKYLTDENYYDVFVPFEKVPKNKVDSVDKIVG